MLSNVACAIDLCRKSQEQHWQRRSLDSLSSAMKANEANEGAKAPGRPCSASMNQSAPGELDESSMARRDVHRNASQGYLRSESPKLFVRKKRRPKAGETHGNQPLLPGDGHDGVIAPWPTRSRVDEDVDGIVGYPRGRRLGKHDIHVGGAEDLLEGIEGEPTQFAFDEIWPILHDGLELDVPISRLPTRNKVEHVGAVHRLPVFAALGAGQGDAEDTEKRKAGDLVAHAEQARVEVDFGRQGGDGYERGVADDE